MFHIMVYHTVIVMMKYFISNTYFSRNDGYTDKVSGSYQSLTIEGAPNFQLDRLIPCAGNYDWTTMNMFHRAVEYYRFEPYERHQFLKEAIALVSHFRTKSCPSIIDEIKSLITVCLCQHSTITDCFPRLLSRKSK